MLSTSPGVIDLAMGLAHHALLLALCGCCRALLATPPSRDAQARRRLRWEAATATLEATTEERRRFDHRAHLARLVGVYVSEERIAGSEAEILVAMQPDQVGSGHSNHRSADLAVLHSEACVVCPETQGGRKLIFLDPVKGRTLGCIELETLSGESQKAPFIGLGDESAPLAVLAEAAPSSVLRGMCVSEECRGLGYSRLFVAIWLKLCLRAGATPATSRINKPLLALTLVRLGFTPLRGRDKPGLRGKPGKKRKAKQQPIAVEVSIGDEGHVLLYCPLQHSRALLQAGFTATELRSQRLLVATEPPEPRGRIAHIRVRYAPPSQAANHGRPDDLDLSHSIEQSPSAASRSQLVHAPLVDAAIGSRLRLCAAQGPTCGIQTAAQKAEAVRVLAGRLDSR